MTSSDESSKLLKLPTFSLQEWVTIILILTVLCVVTYYIVDRYIYDPDKDLSRARLHALMKAIEEYRNEYGYYPSYTTPMKLTPSFFDESWGFGKYKGLSTNSRIKALLGERLFDSGSNGLLIVDENSHSFWYQCPAKQGGGYDLWTEGLSLHDELLEELPSVDTRQ